MFLFEYAGDRTDLIPQDPEISDIQFVQIHVVKEWLSHQESLAFFQKHVLGQYVTPPINRGAGFYHI